jgi:ribosomal protein L7/L12
MAITDPQLQDMMKNDRKIEAIKRYRELTNAGLKESKDAIEAVMDSMPRKVWLSHADALDDSQLRDYLKGGFTINAIKRYRELTGSGLLEAKRAIENYIGERK